MRSPITVIVAMALTAALWCGGTGPAFAQGQCNQPFAPGASLGPVRLGMPVDAVQRWYGRPRSVQNQFVQGHQWTRMIFSGLEAVARDNMIVALNLPQIAGAPLQSNCGTPLAGPFSLPVSYVQQTYGSPSSSYVTNGVQYWLYDALGLLLSLPIGGRFVQGLWIYPAGQYCAVEPVIGIFRGVVYNPNPGRCVRSAGDHER